ncbi:uncharacterized protein LOC141601632 [Silene latifolia]|uniref:uncharacterized protein LOC141601632 n=1 Tax=Silene latifolia TaxID=37657 RepID=UPI003D78AE14
MARQKRNKPKTSRGIRIITNNITQNRKNTPNNSITPNNRINGSRYQVLDPDDDGLLEEASDDGSDWTEVSNQPQSPESSRVSRLQLSDTDVENELAYWSTAVYCYVLGANRPFKVVEGFVKRVWGYTEYDQISFHSNVVVKEWTPQVKLVREALDVVHIWIRFYGLPLKFWGNALNKIARLVGKPIRCDSNTLLKTFIGHARIMVEVKMRKDLPDVIEFTDELGIDHRQIVHYEWKPVICSECKGLGHFGRDCRKKQANGKGKIRKQWVPKPATDTVVVIPDPDPPVAPMSQEIASIVPTRLVTPIPISFTPFSSARILTRLTRQGGTQVGTGGRSFMENAIHYKVEVLNKAAQVINARVTFLPTGEVWWLSLVVMGDFNNVLAMNERIGSEVSDAEHEAGDMVFSRIDRAMVNDEWLLRFQDTITMFHPEGLFDHCPCTMVLNPKGGYRKGSFKYFNMWGKDPEFISVVKRIWEQQVPGFKMFQFVKKLKALKKPLKDLNHYAYSNIETTTKVALMLLHNAQRKLHLDPFNISLQQEAHNAALVYQERADARRSFLA